MARCLSLAPMVRSSLDVYYLDTLLITAKLARPEIYVSVAERIINFLKNK